MRDSTKPKLPSTSRLNPVERVDTFNNTGNNPGRQNQQGTNQNQRQTDSFNRLSNNVTNARQSAEQGASWAELIKTNLGNWFKGVFRLMLNSLLSTISKADNYAKNDGNNTVDNSNQEQPSPAPSPEQTAEVQRNFCNAPRYQNTGNTENSKCNCSFQVRYKDCRTGKVDSGTFSAPCRGNIQQIRAALDATLLPDAQAIAWTRISESGTECQTTVTARISQVDDIATIYIDGKPALTGYYAPGGKGGDTGWRPLNVAIGKHQLRLEVNNTAPGESGGWFEIKVNGKLRINQGRTFRHDTVTGIKYNETTTLTVS